MDFYRALATRQFFKITQTCRVSGLTVFQNYDVVDSARIAQLDVNKRFKQTKTDLKPILSLTFNRIDRCIEYSVVLSAKLDEVINIISLPLKIILRLRKKPINLPREGFKGWFPLTT